MAAWPIHCWDSASHLENGLACLLGKLALLPDKHMYRNLKSMPPWGMPSFQ